MRTRTRAPVCLKGILRAACELLHERGLGRDTAVPDEAYLRNDPKAGMDLLWETMRFPEAYR